MYLWVLDLDLVMLWVQCLCHQFDGLSLFSHEKTRKSKHSAFSTLFLLLCIVQFLHTLTLLYYFERTLWDFMEFCTDLNVKDAFVCNICTVKKSEVTQYVIATVAFWECGLCWVTLPSFQLSAYYSLPVGLPICSSQKAKPPTSLTLPCQLVPYMHFVWVSHSLASVWDSNLPYFCWNLV